MAEINEIVSKEAIEGVKQLDKYIISADGNLQKFILSAKDIDKAFKLQANSIQNVATVQKKVTENAKVYEKATKSVTDAQRALDRQRQAGLALLARQEAKERELNAAIKMEVKSIDDAVKQNKALTEARKKLDITTADGKDKLQQYNAAMTKNTEFIRANGTAMEKQRMNIGNYKSALEGIGSKLIAAFSVTAILEFGRAAFSAYEEQEKANRKLIYALRGSKAAFEELTKQANKLQSETGIADDAIQGIQVLGAQAGKSTGDIKKITEATVNWSKLTGQDLQSAYLQINATLNGTAGRLTRVDSEFGNLTESQLRAGAAIDLINKKYAGFAANAASETEKLAANWEEFKESAGGALANVINPLLENTNSLMQDINNKQGFWQKMATLFGFAAGPGVGIGISSALDAKNAIADSKNKINSEAIRNAESTKALVAKAVAEAKAKVATLDYSEAEKIAAENVDKHTKAIKKLIDLSVSANTEMEWQQTQQIIAENEARKIAVKIIEDESAALLELSDAKQSADYSKRFSIGVPTALAGLPSLTLGQQFNALGTQDKKQLAIDSAQITADASFNIIQNSMAAEYDLKMSYLEREKEAKLNNANLTEKQKAKITADYEKKAAKMKAEQFKKEKAAAIVQSIINTALAVTAAMAAIPFSLPRAILAGITGAAQTAVIAAQPIPKFDKGTTNSPDTFIAGEKRPEFLITPSGSVQHVTKPTLFKGMAGSTVISGEDTERIMKVAGRDGLNGLTLMPDIKGMTDEIVSAIRNKSELHINTSGTRITERQGNYEKQYFNRKVSWQRNQN